MAKHRKLRKSDYTAYINSNDWRAKKQQYFKSKLPKYCFICEISDVRLDLHHLTYKTLGHENLNHLRLVCRPCHDKIHSSAEETGKSLWQATMNLSRRARTKRKKERNKQIRRNGQLPSLVELENSRNWNKINLERWGIPWPPKRGWHKKLKRVVEAHSDRSFAPRGA